MAVIKEDKGDAGADAQTQYTLSLGDIFQGTLDSADDKDWIKVELSAETIYDFTLTGVDSAELPLFDVSGNWIVSGGYTPSGTKLIFSPPVSGTYYIGVGSYDDAVTGGYELALTENTIPLGSYDEIAEYLVDGFAEWQGGARHAFVVAPGGTLSANVTALTEEGQQLAKWALEAWTNVTGINFEFVEHNHADITFSNRPDTAATGGPVAVRNGLIISSGVNIPPELIFEHGTTIDSYPLSIFIHEIGHALGLGHPGPYPQDYNNPVAYYGIETIFLLDSEQVTVMSYIAQSQNTYLDASWAIPVTPMLADIIAIQDLYGVPGNINTGDTIYGYQSNLDGYLGEFFKLWSGEANPFSGIQAPSDSGTPTVKLALTDLDGDGDPDLVVGNDTGLLYYYENIGTPAKPDFVERTSVNNPLEGISVWSYSAPTFTDLDGDGDLDIIVGDGNDAIAYFENTGTVSAPHFTQRTDTANPFKGITISAWSTLTLADLDGDGDLDLAVGTEGGDIPYYENTGTATNPDFVLRSGASSPLNNVSGGFHNTPAFADVDGDNDFDLVVGSNNGDILYFENTGTTTEPVFVQRAGFDNPFHATVAGYWIGLEFADLNADSHPDLIVGNQDGIIHYFESVGTPENPEFSPSSLALPTTFTIYDNGGTDTLDVRTDTNDQRIYLRPEGISDVYGLIGNMSIARDTWIENYIAGSGDDLIAGNAIANDINGRAGNDRIWGSGGDDILEGGAGADRLDGDAGMDWAAYRDSDAAVTINLAEGMVQGGHAEGDILTEIENIIGSAHDDVLVGNDEANWLEGGGGDDILEGGAGEDRLDGDGGMDWAVYRDSDEAVTVNLVEGIVRGGHAEGDILTEVENIIGSAHDDVLVGNDEANQLEGGGGADRLDGGAGSDWAFYKNSNEGVTVDFAEGTAEGGHAEGDVLTEIENIIGSAHDDVLVGDDAANRLEGGGGADRLDGGAGSDWASYQGSNEGVTVDLAAGTAAGGDAQGDVIENIENLSGSGFADVLRGDGNANRLDGGGGDDWLLGSSGADQFDGGAGLDGLSYELSAAGVTVNLGEGTSAGGDAQGDVVTGIEHVMGSEYRDVLTGDAGGNEFYGLGGDDELKGDAGDDTLEGGAGGDRLDGGAGLDWAVYLTSDAGVTVNLADSTVAGGHAQGDTFTGIENIAGSGYEDVLTGDSGTNELYGADGNDELRGGAGNDVLEGGAGADRLDGGAGGDWVVYLRSDTGVTVDLHNNTVASGHAEGDVLSGIENIAGSRHADVLAGDDSANELAGNEGADELHGNGGDDVLAGGAGADSLHGDEGDDELHGGAGDDWLYGNAGADWLEGGSGIDTLSYQDSDQGIIVNLVENTVEGGHAQGDVIRSIENVIGTDYADVIRGDDGANHLVGGAGDDRLYGGAGADRLDGGEGIDWIDYWSSDAGVMVNLKEGTAEGGHAEGDVIVAVERVWGSRYSDILIGDDGDNLLDSHHGDDDLQGEGGDDWMDGGPGADKLDGGEGSDWVSYWRSDTGVTVNLEDGTGRGGYAEGDVIVNIERIEGSSHGDTLIGDGEHNYIYGLAGPDRIIGGAGNDRLYGNAYSLDEEDRNGNVDVFVFDVAHGNDSIYDFVDNEDNIDLSAFDLSGFDDLSLSSDDQGTTIDLSAHDGGTILLVGFDMANLDASDFLF